MADLNVRPITSVNASKTKEEPSERAIGSSFIYHHSQDGADENLLVLFHGLGDTHHAFARIGRAFNLPQCAVLSIRSQEKVPLLYEEAYQWYPAFDQFGEFLKHPNPSEALDWLFKVLQYLTEDLNWPPNRIHLFGFSQGGTVAAELALKWWRSQKAGCEDPSLRALGSVVTVSGPLLSYPTIPQDARCPSPLLFFRRSMDSQTTDDDVKAFGKGFANVNDAKIAGEAGMPRSREEWYPIMKFWSDHLGRREMSGAYEVVR